MSQNNRRVFMMQIAAASTAMVTGTARAEAKKLEESEPQAIALGYKDDSRNVDAKRFPKHAASQSCANCTIWIGKEGTGGKCHVFGSRLLSGTGWCSQWVGK
jgi:High potential iron-sulfur protein